MNNFDPMTGEPINNNQQNRKAQNGQGYNYNQNYNQQGQNTNNNQGYSQNQNNPNYNPNYNRGDGYRPPNSGYQNGGYTPYGYQNGGGGYGGGYPNCPNGRLPIQYKSIVMYILLSLVTCGIFGFYWMYCINEDVNNSLGENDMSGGMVILLTIVTCGIYGIIWAYSLGNKTTRLKRMMGDPYADSGLGTLYLVLCIFTTYIVPLALTQNELNKYAEFR